MQENNTESTCILHSASHVNNLPNHITVIKYRKLTFSPSTLVSFPCSRVYYPGSHFAVSKNSFIFKSCFRFIAKRSGKYKEFPYSICPPPRASYTISLHYQPLIEHLLNLHWHIIMQRPSFTLGFTFGIVQSMDLDKFTNDWYPPL